MEFESLKSALGFKKTCPYCFEELEIRSKKHVGEAMKDHVPELSNGKLFYKVFSYVEKERDIVIDIENSSLLGNDSIFTGIHYAPLRIECMKCHQYYQIFNLVIDGLAQKISKITINNICLKRIIGNYEFSLISSLSLDKTLFSKIKLYKKIFPPSENSLDWSNVLPREIIFPYVEINLENPDETILRLDSLLIFN